MGMYGERLGRGVTREAARKYETSVTERARRERWQASGCARVVSRKYGTVVVPHGSNFAALLNAAEVWGCDWTEIRDAEVYARFSHQVGLFRSAWWAQFSASQFSASQLSQNTRWKSSSHGPDRIGRAPRKSPRTSGEAVILSKLFTARPPLCGGPHPPERSTRPAPIPLPSRNRLSVLR